MYLSVFGEFGREVESHAEFLELDTDGRRAARRSALNDGEAELAPGQETRLLAGLGERVGLSKEWQQIPPLQGAERRAHVDIRAEQKDIQKVWNREACWRRGRRLRWG